MACLFSQPLPIFHWPEHPLEYIKYQHTVKISIGKEQGELLPFQLVAQKTCLVVGHRQKAITFIQ